MKKSNQMNDAVIDHAKKLAKADAVYQDKQQGVTDAKQKRQQEARWFLNNGYDYNMFYTPRVNDKTGDKPKGTLTVEQHDALRIEVACARLDAKSAKHLRLTDEEAKATLTVDQYSDRNKSKNKSSTWIARLGDAIKAEYRLTLGTEEQEQIKAEEDNAKLRNKVLSLGKQIHKQKPERISNECATHIQALYRLLK